MLRQTYENVPLPCRNTTGSPETRHRDRTYGCPPPRRVSSHMDRVLKSCGQAFPLGPPLVLEMLSMLLAAPRRHSRIYGVRRALIRTPACDGAVLAAQQNAVFPASPNRPATLHAAPQTGRTLPGSRMGGSGFAATTDEDLGWRAQPRPAGGPRAWPGRWAPEAWEETMMVAGPRRVKPGVVLPARHLRRVSDESFGIRHRTNGAVHDREIPVACGNAKARTRPPCPVIGTGGLNRRRAAGSCGIADPARPSCGGS